MNLERLYLKLPESLKYNPKILKLSLNISEKINKNSNDNQNSQYQLLNMLFTEYDLKLKGPRRNIQKLYVEVLRFIDNVCKKHEIKYWLGFGTLLGAVRHEGFIPWDDDIDLGILREDYNKLIEVLPEEISKYDYLKKNCGLTLLLENEKNYFKDFNDFCKVVDQNNNHYEMLKLNFLQIGWIKPLIKIDIFPMDFVKEDKVNELRETFVSKKYKFHHDLKNPEFNFKKELNLRRKEAGFVDSKTKFFSDTFESVYFWRVRIFEYDKTFPLKSIKFEGYEFPCPSDYDSHLKETFNEEYMNIPPTIESHNLLPFIEKQFNSKKEMEECFEKSINYLKEINDNFAKND